MNKRQWASVHLMALALMVLGLCERDLALAAASAVAFTLMPRWRP